MSDVEYYSGLTLALSHMQRIKCQPNESIFFSDSLARDFVEQLYGQFQPLLRALEEISTETQFCLR